MIYLFLDQHTDPKKKPEIEPVPIQPVTPAQPEIIPSPEKIDPTHPLQPEIAPSPEPGIQPVKQ
ncbi:MAG TPA: hypothetical protein VL651_08605 [Bacteroidia bacterium]|jgi:hypothetical protein|nr:hypothetical protein [Bacteroidia bacterium]